jgi:hypothetical protein
MVTRGRGSAAVSVTAWVLVMRCVPSHEAEWGHGTLVVA